MENRVSKASVRAVISEFFTDEFVEKIMNGLERAADLERHGEIGMTYGEWKSRFDDEHTIVWAANTKGGFGYAGDRCSGNCDDCRIVAIVSDGYRKVLHLWDDLMGSLEGAEKPYMIREHITESSFIGYYGSLKDAVMAGREKFRAFDVFSWGGARWNGSSIWEFARKVC